MTRRTIGRALFIVCVIAAPFVSTALAVRGVAFPWHYLAGFAVLGVGVVVTRMLVRPRT